MKFFDATSSAFAVARELLPDPPLPRGSPPTQVLGEDIIVAAMRDGGLVDGRTAGGYLFNSAHITHALSGCRTCIDLGCCTGQQLLQVAMLNPRVTFIGVDQSRTLLDVAAEFAARAGVTNVQYVQDDITKLETLPDGCTDAVISSMTLNDLPDLGALSNCFAAIQRVLARRVPRVVYVEDFLRMKSSRTIDFLTDMLGRSRSDPFSRLYATALHSAFSLQELRDCASRHFTDIEIYATRPLPFLAVMRTPARQPSDPAVAALLNRERGKLSPTQHRDLVSLNLMFSLGGMKGNPFTAD